MKEPILWKDQVEEHPNRYVETSNSDGTVDHVKSPGKILQEGTPINANNLNNMDNASIEAIMMAAFNADMIHKLQIKTDNIEGEKQQITLNNSQKYPFNNSQKTIALLTPKSSKDYNVLVEIVSKTGEGVGDVIISDKLLNGFKIEYTGAATQVVMNVAVIGGV